MSSGSQNVSHNDIVPRLTITFQSCKMNINNSPSSLQTIPHATMRTLASEFVFVSYANFDQKKINQFIIL